MARRIIPTDDDILRLAMKITDEMLRKNNKPTRAGAEHLGSEQEWKIKCADHDVGFFNMIREWVNENADRDERQNGAGGIFKASNSREWWRNDEPETS